MKRPLLLVLAFLLVHMGFAQSQFYIGLKGGIGGCFYQYNAGAANANIPLNYQGGSSKISSRGPSIPAKFELIYSIGKFRVGYQFEYERILTTAYKFRTLNYSQSIFDTTINSSDITQHFFCHNLLIEYRLFSYKHLNLVPDLSFGYFHGISNATDAPYDFNSLNQNRFKIGVALNLEYQLGQVSIVATPNYGLVPIKSIYDPTQKGYMHFVGLDIGIRIGTIKQPDPANPNATPKKKKKEYVNPEDDN